MCLYKRCADFESVGEHCYCDTRTELIRPFCLSNTKAIPDTMDRNCSACTTEWYLKRGNILLYAKSYCVNVLFGFRSRLRWKELCSNHWYCYSVSGRVSTCLPKEQKGCIILCHWAKLQVIVFKDKQIPWPRVLLSLAETESTIFLKTCSFTDVDSRRIVLVLESSVVLKVFLASLLLQNLWEKKFRIQNRQHV